MELQVAIRIFEEREQKHLSHILALSSKRGEVAMLTVPASSADVIFIKRDEPGASVFLQPGRERKLPIAVLYDDEQDGHPWFLRQPATSTDLIPLLRALRAEVDTLPRHASTEPISHVSSAPLRTDGKLMVATPIVPTITGQALLEKLKDCCEGSKVISVQLDSSNHLIIDGTKKTVHVPARYMEMARTLLDILVMFRASDYVELSNSEFTRLLVQTQLTPVPLEQFTWMACHHVEPQLPIPDAIANLAFKLKRWPTFTRLRYKPVHMQWSGRLIKTAQSMSNLTMGVMDDMIEAAKFYNACVVGGLAMVDAVDVMVASVASSAGQAEKKSVFQRILQRLKK